MSSPLTDAAPAYPAAELDRRFYAFVIDRVLAWGIFAAAGYLAWRVFIEDDRVGLGALVVVGTVVLVSLLYAVLLGVAGLSPGKALVGLRVVAVRDGRPIGVPQALLRVALLGVLTLPTAGVGLATLALTAVLDPSGQRRGGHDRLGDAVVVDVRPVPEVEDDADDRPRQIVNLTALRLMPTPPPAPAPAPVAAAPAPTPSAPTPSAPPPSSPPSSPPPVAAPPAAGPPPARPPGRRRAAPSAAPSPAAPPAAPPAAAPGAVSPTAPPAAAPGVWRVRFDTGEELVVEGLALVGRRPEPRGDEPVRHVIPLRSSDMSVSKTHAQFQVVPDGALVVMDRGSTNGSVLVRQGVSRALTAGRPATLVDGDTVRFGDRTMTVTREHA